LGTSVGQTQLTDSFDRRPIAAMLHESRFLGLRDTTFSVQLRSFYLDRENFDTSQSAAWTLGGSAGFQTGYFGQIVALGATVFTSQRLYGPNDKEGAQLLLTGQKPYTVLGELYAQFHSRANCPCIQIRATEDSERPGVFNPSKSRD